MSWFTGIWNRVTGFDEENAARAEIADRQLAVLNAELRDRGVWTEEDYRIAEANRLADDSTTDSVAVAQQTMNEFAAGAREGLAREQKWVKDTTGGVIKGAFGFVPWWAWIVAAVWAAWQLGWLKKLRA